MCPAAEPCWLCSCTLADGVESSGSNDELLSEDDYDWDDESLHQNTSEAMSHTGIANLSSLYCNERLPCRDW